MIKSGVWMSSVDIIGHLSYLHQSVKQAVSKLLSSLLIGTLAAISIYPFPVNLLYCLSNNKASKCDDDFIGMAANASYGCDKSTKTLKLNRKCLLTGLVQLNICKYTEL